MKNPIILILFVLITGSLMAQKTKPVYNENADPRTDIKLAIDKARQENKQVIIQFGGNWCPWCVKFHGFINQVPEIDSLVKADYVYVLANVPKEKDKRDFSLFQEYQFPNRFGYPVFVILDKHGKELHIQDSGILEHCSGKGYDTTKVVTFFKMWNRKALDPATYQK